MPFDLVHRRRDADLVGELIEVMLEEVAHADGAGFALPRQVLEYASLKLQEAPRMVIFLDCPLDLPRVDVAARLGVSVVVEGLAGFVLATPSTGHVHGQLAKLFTV